MGDMVTTTGTFTVMIAAVTPDPDPMPDPDPDPDPMPTPVAVDVIGVTEGYMISMGTYPISAGMMRTVGDIDFMCTGSEDCEVTVAMDADGMMTIMATGMVTAQDSRAYLESQLAAIEKETQEARDKADRDERINRADMILADIAGDDAVNTAGGTGTNGTTAKAVPGRASGITANNADNDVATDDGLMVTRNAAGMITVDVNGADNDDEYSGGTTTAGSDAWNGVMLTKTDAATEAQDLVAIYTDIEAPADKKFNEQYVLADRNDILNDAGRLEKAESASFPTGNTRTVQFGGDSGNDASFEGMFDGVPGTYECTAQAACTLTTDDEGELVVSAGWSFSPNSNLATVKDPDAAYAYFGWWLNKPKEPDDPHMTEVFAGATADDADAVDAIVGNATYMGPAAGKYATRTFSAGVKTDGAAGHFTADATLTAKFGGDAAAGTISGAVNNFVLDDTTPMSSWRVMLEDADLDNASNDFNGTTEVNFGGGMSDNPIETADSPTPAELAAHPGRWQGSFYGPGEDNAAPSTVIGTFAAEMPNAAVLGGFGATLQE